MKKQSYKLSWKVNPYRRDRRTGALSPVKRSNYAEQLSRWGVVGMNKQEIENTLRDYNWMINEIKRQRELLSDAGDNMSAKYCIESYDIESAMPKRKGNTSEPVTIEVIRRDKNSKWVRKLEQKVLFIQRNISMIRTEREKAILECLLDGMSMIAISRHMGLSRTHIYNIKDSIVTQWV